MRLKKISEEIEYRNKKKLKNYNVLLKKFNSKLNIFRNKKQVKECKKILRFIRQDKNKNEDLKNNYHILRVAYYSLNYTGSKNNLDICKLALVHNIFEKEIEVKKLKKTIDIKTLKHARVLKINRKKQWNKDYIKKYYIRLNSSHKNAKIIKCLDKFDNLFSLFKNPKKEIKQMYLQEINLFILPLVEKFLPNISNYYKKLISYNFNLIR